ncbi:MAG: 3-methyl-2-oxobutanoate hydroxymethyltransferase [Candidatus Bipolaricaulota bacterium]|nr:3-methyl-2-oxobutanoate hydroxymethyltransferase [Candidatus Bipolaricaulota bacterium]MCS7274516.1 3-methyl-2-oxobutanoate hydroxymethyltransferase [Candidatus Bipolaricaulota bacterium]MDW8111087.1 3-methyl-2-oxobutanoate hydroxymethyltransferase [Candidatus Bipolaricaulota bacterium]MDW8329083.1 3-methyl-2-oxobutanoate hydroxymethyltransferase [Candidatus Bipolaricaulota bacterium]
MDERVTIPGLLKLKEKGEKIACLTAYDWPTALLLDRAGIDLILVGDSVGNNILGYPSTIPVTMDEMIHHTKAVRRGVKRALLVGDMPFMSYQASAEEAIRNAGRFIKEGGADAVKLEGGEEIAELIHTLVRRGLPVMGHLGLLPQRTAQVGGYKVQGRDEASAKKILHEAKILEEAGVFALVLEMVPWPLAKLISETLQIPTIGIGAGPYCDGQILVITDVLGLSLGVSPKFAKRYLALAEQIEQAAKAYCTDVKSLTFPTVEQHSFAMDEEVLKKLSSDG